MKRWRGRWSVGLALGLITLAGLALRIAAWRWHEFRPLGGDEREYLDLAIYIAQGNGYYDLQFMRPPLFPLGLAVVVWLANGDLQWLRFANVLISTATIPLIFWWTHTLLSPRHPTDSATSHPARNTVALLAAALAALSYTLALNATELLTEAATLAGITLSFILLRHAERSERLRWTVLAGVVIALVCLVRSVALPLLVLGAWQLQNSKFKIQNSKNPAVGRVSSSPPPTAHRPPTTNSLDPQPPTPDPRRWRKPLVLVLAALLTIAPWTIRNAVTYGGFILIDTTGPENLWLDNDPAGREAVKAQLYALANDRVARSSLATERGVAALTQDTGWVLTKMGREFRRFWALEHTDDLLARPAIWVRPAEVWLRLIAGDGGWLLLLLAGSVGLLRLPVSRKLRLVLAAWALYTVFTGALFHVEYRYRLPLYPVLLPCAAWALAAAWRWWRERRLRQHIRWPRSLTSAILPLSLLVLTLSWGGYPEETMRLGRKHLLLWQGERALARAMTSAAPPDFVQTSGGIDIYDAQVHAASVLQLDPDSVLARVLLARVALLQSQTERADEQLQTAIRQLPAHPYAHLLRGDLLRAQGDLDQARRELAYETASGEDLQAWTRARFSQTPFSTTLDIGGGLDLGFVGGFYAAENDGTRWLGDQASLLLAPPQAASSLVLHVAAQRPAGVASANLLVEINGGAAGTYPISNDWRDITVPLPANINRAVPLAIVLRATATFTPHDHDPTNPDGRDLGVRLDWAQLR